MDKIFIVIHNPFGFGSDNDQRAYEPLKIVKENTTKGRLTSTN
jgi:hypothetical protein